jgi:hypothetical protein
MGMSEADAPRSERRTRVRIDELVLVGFPPGDRFRIAEQVRRELARRIQEQAVMRPARKAAVDAGSFQVAPGASAEAIGGRVARALHGGLTGRRGRR